MHIHTLCLQTFITCVYLITSAAAPLVLTPFVRNQGRHPRIIVMIMIIIIRRNIMKVIIMIVILIVVIMIIIVMMILIVIIVTVDPICPQPKDGAGLALDK